ncbi:hypothetical protein CVO76_00470 [Arthrobacter agilis]|uniref:Methyltransferase domain-containing protein n=1 Tax=Arthrobacter agilis TaxID=37921 RepID=A0A2L0UIT8_9MICC|nr:hypothetical protein CVO76_00470 [Arthrobacter agilis]
MHYGGLQVHVSTLDRRRHSPFAWTTLDPGCGTGIFTVTPAGEGRDVVSVDPSPTMLSYAQHREGADTVEWILGDSGSVPRSRLRYRGHLRDLDADAVRRHLPPHHPDRKSTLRICVPFTQRPASTCALRGAPHARRECPPDGRTLMLAQATKMQNG